VAGIKPFSALPTLPERKTTSSCIIGHKTPIKQGLFRQKNFIEMLALLDRHDSIVIQDQGKGQR
jgi:hypothetical protein